MMRILFVGFPYSVHAAHWISLVADQGWDLHFFPSQDNPYLHPELRNLTFWSGFSRRRLPGVDPSVRIAGLWPYERGTNLLYRSLSRLAPRGLDRAEWLAWVIRMLKPDIVHSMEFQHAGYLTLDAKSRSNRAFPRWLASNWGCDIHLYGRLTEHREKITALLRECDYYSCECHRDVRLARQLGFKGEVLPVAPNSGGVDLAGIAAFGQVGPPSSRRVIAVKGYHRHMHRAQVALRALALTADVLGGYKIRLYSVEPREIVATQAEVISQETGLNIELMPPVSHDEMLRLHGSARLSISLSLSDGICTSMLEAMAMGSFPIQSWTACADEWIEDGASGFLVPPEDPHAVAGRIRKAVLSDQLVDMAAARNESTIRARADRSLIREVVIRDYYQHIHRRRRGSRLSTDAVADQL
jgi:glycosyltransferase involved in cell wall biosynthesis